MVVLGKLAFPLLLKCDAVTVSLFQTETAPPAHQIKSKLLNMAPELQDLPLLPFWGHLPLLLTWTSHQPPATLWTPVYMHPLTIKRAVPRMGVPSLTLHIKVLLLELFQVP